MSEDKNTATSQYLTFTLDRELFALPVAWVREILEYVPVTRIPRMPGDMLGVINVRGRAVPVTSLRRKFGMQADTVDVETCIIILETGHRDQVTGVMADAVSQVVEIPDQDVEPPPAMGASVDAAFMAGMARLGQGFVILLAPEAVSGQAQDFDASRDRAGSNPEPPVSPAPPGTHAPA